MIDFPRVPGHRTGMTPLGRRILAGLCVAAAMGAGLAPAAAPAAPAPAAASQDGVAGGGPPPVLPAPPVPDFGPLPAGARPPQPVIGVFDTNEIMRQSVAVQQVEQEMGTRREALIHDVRAEEEQIQALRQRMLNAPRDQAEAQQRALQQRLAADRQKFGNRNRILQEDTQIALNQVQREVDQVLATVAKSRGLTIVVQSSGTVLHGPQVDISEQVASRLNAVLPHVYLPAANEDPEVIAKSGKFPTAPVQMTDPNQQG
ncbi:putative outer membrane protein [Gluconacetobacter diazotrophicus PA1 5]|nr:putative outer membrane protein [Gluconacetobacter diazotrophicus PA1 5]